jgi:hypothetical protein
MVTDDSGGKFPMKHTILAVSVAIMLAACGRGGHPGAGARSDADNEVCRLLGDPTVLFGAGATSAGYRGIEQMAASCEFSSADGARAGEIVTFTAASLGPGATPAAKLQEITQKWATQTATPLAPVPELGDGARMATDLPGYQTQVAFVKNATLVLVQARTGDAATAPGAALARSMARTAAASIH